MESKHKRKEVNIYYPKPFQIKTYSIPKKVADLPGFNLGRTNWHSKKNL